MTRSASIPTSYLPACTVVLFSSGLGHLSFILSDSFLPDYPGFAFLVLINSIWLHPYSDCPLSFRRYHIVFIAFGSEVPPPPPTLPHALPTGTPAINPGPAATRPFCPVL